MSSMPIDYDNARLWENCCRTGVLALLTTYCLGGEIQLCNGMPYRHLNWSFLRALLMHDSEVYFYPHGRRDGSVAAEMET
eukprot:9828484-Ditylum_brightwellii.AAC.1